MFVVVFGLVIYLVDYCICYSLLCYDAIGKMIIVDNLFSCS